VSLSPTSCMPGMGLPLRSSAASRLRERAPARIASSAGGTSAQCLLAGVRCALRKALRLCLQELGLRVFIVLWRTR
jgi:hypothetical protein